MNKAFVNFPWENTPSINSPLNASNLNKINNGLNTVDDRVIAMDTSKANKQDLLTDVVAVAYNATTGVWTFTKRNGSTQTFDQNIEKIPVSFSMSSSGVITMTTADGTSYTADIGSILPVYNFIDSSVIDFTVTTDAQTGAFNVTASIKAGSITDSMLETNYLANITIQAQNAAGSADSALLSANSAATDALMAESHNHGNTGIRQDEATDNAKYYKEQAAQSKLDSEAWAKGTRNGVPVTSSDPAYQNNAEYFKDQAQQIVGIGIATTTVAGIVKPDGETISVEADGKITAGISETEWTQLQSLWTI